MPDHVRIIDGDGAGIVTADGDRATLEELQRVLAGYLDDGERVATTIRAAESAGFVFDD